MRGKARQDRGKPILKP